LLVVGCWLLVVGKINVVIKKGRRKAGLFLFKPFDNLYLLGTGYWTATGEIDRQPTP
jgi:hypothetical protein